MNHIHIYSAVMQPAIGWVDTHSGEPIKMGFDPEKLIYTDCCGRQRAAVDCVVQSFYDYTAIYCAPNKGCKDPEFIAAKKAKEFANRSAGQKKRWSKKNAP